MLKLNIQAVGKTIEHKGEVALVLEGEMPVDCMVIFMDKDSWEKLKVKVEPKE